MNDGGEAAALSRARAMPTDAALTRLAEHVVEQPWMRGDTGRLTLPIHPAAPGPRPPLESAKAEVAIDGVSIEVHRPRYDIAAGEAHLELLNAINWEDG